MPCPLRPLRSTDAAEWRQLWSDYLVLSETTVSEEVYISTFTRLLGADPQDFNYLVAEVEDRVVGLAHYLFHRHGRKIDHICYRPDLYVEPDARCIWTGRAQIERSLPPPMQPGCRRSMGCRRMSTIPPVSFTIA